MSDVLLLDNNGDDFVKDLLDAMRDRGYHVTVTDRLKEARRLIAKAKLDLVLVNILLPEETAREVLELARQQGIRTFLLTGGAARSEHAVGLPGIFRIAGPAAVTARRVETGFIFDR
jgi:DNA-binding response OmpR family regulator